MISIQLIRENPAFVKERLAVKNFGQPGLVDEILQLDESRRKIQHELDITLNAQNQAAKAL